MKIPKNQSFVDGFWIHWELNNFENIPQDSISIQVQVGNQIWQISDPLSLSDYIELSIKQERTEIVVIVSVADKWNKSGIVVVTIEQPSGVYTW